MTEDHQKLLAVLDVRIHDLIALCDEREQKVQELDDALSKKEDELQTANHMIEELNAKCENLLTARVVSASAGDKKESKAKISQLVREVDKCIALLNE